MKNAVASPGTIQKYLNRVGYTVALRARLLLSVDLGLGPEINI
jgi:hypothetical protein